MNRLAKELIVIVIIVIALIAGKILFDTFRDNRLEKQTILRTESEMRFKQLAKELFVLKVQKDSLVIVNVALDSIIEVQKSNPSKIIIKYETIHVSVDNLDAVNSVVLFTNNITKYSNNRQRYSGFNSIKGR